MFGTNKSVPTDFLPPAPFQFRLNVLSLTRCVRFVGEVKSNFNRASFALPWDDDFRIRGDLGALIFNTSPDVGADFKMISLNNDLPLEGGSFSAIDILGAR
jgi:hypothetical protein